ncbi:thioesterase II family protein [Streptosporangium sp. 'caverna']|uniref:thioesterase II family protein n=1 Tax=Streptosporangium sp. 'caverna' TaxID=2202249 RepID=UPI000D7D6DC8|nr:alpha/beta fold hydrolase [Streptosporangium sp. 'caverna']AWS44279.1 thioesterase [Streptosporangium sp. 'caverna']
MTGSPDFFDQWFKSFHHDGADVRLICLPHAGGSASGFFRLSAALPPWIEVLAAQYPGRQERRREPAFTEVRALAEALAELLADRQDRPYVLLGHSMGAVVAFELALSMRRRGARSPGMLIASGRRAPSTTRAESVHRLDDAGVANELRLLNGTDPTFLQDPELIEMIMPVLRADYQALETYQAVPNSVVACPITALVGDHDPRTTIDEARAWQAHTVAEFDLRIFAGGHFFFDDRLSEVVNVLTDILLPYSAAAQDAQM